MSRGRCDRCESEFADHGGIHGYIVRGYRDCYDLCAQCFEIVLEVIDCSVKLYSEGKVLRPAHMLQGRLEGKSDFMVGQCVGDLARKVNDGDNGAEGKEGS